MLRKLFTLVFFAAVSTASAQLINVVELNTPSGSAYHVYEGSANGRFDYSLGSNVIVSASDVWIINGRLITNDRHPDVDFPAAYEIIGDLGMPDLGMEGKWFNKDTRDQITVREQDFLTINSFTPLVMAGFTFDERTQTHYYRTDCDRHYRTYRSNDPFNPGRYLWFTTWWSGWDAETNTGNYEAANGIISAPVANLSDLITAIDAHSDSFGECNTCIVPNSPAEDIFAQLEPLGFRYEGFGLWIDRATDERGFLVSRWNQIETRNGQFRLEVGAGSEGHTGTFTYFDCLDELIATLQ